MRLYSKTCPLFFCFADFPFAILPILWFNNLTDLGNAELFREPEYIVSRLPRTCALGGMI